VKLWFTNTVCVLLAFGASAQEIRRATDDAPTVKVTPLQLDFGTQPVGKKSSPQTVTLTNAGATPVTITDIIPSGIDFGETHNCGATLPPGAECTINITFTPAIAGSRLGALVILDSVPGSPARVALTGIGEETGEEK
jgi:hypothetical protein